LEKYATPSIFQFALIHKHCKQAKMSLTMLRVDMYAAVCLADDGRSRWH